MKYLVVLILGACAYWAYQNYSLSEAELSLSEKLRHEGSVSASEVFSTAKELVVTICNDSELQQAWGNTPDKCLQQAQNLESSCRQQVFADTEKNIDSIPGIKALLAQYHRCVLP
ncbi:hypothetical protein [Agaribacterium haliotis]|uniref:hypothetical protein n=1 Tax=Agaribacterium haliotis TaxID=2013869 RepID=UPI000BB52BFA|nr:hypothetical protein [Agaribacterium haliotis]